MKVTLISHSTCPLDSICVAIANMTTKNPIEYVKGMSEGAKEVMIDEAFKSRLRGPLEFCDFHFHIDGVTRAFTHQLVRHRMASFSQQSLRFFKASQSGFGMPVKITDAQRIVIERTVDNVLATYDSLLEMSCPTEEARSILPTNILTLISFRMTYRGLVDMAEVRFCSQAQGEFREVMEAIKLEVAKVSPYLASKMVAACERSGHCEFRSTFDRPCPAGKRKD